MEFRAGFNMFGFRGQRWKERSAQDKRLDLAKVVNGVWGMGTDEQERLDMVEYFIDRLAKDQNVKAEDIIKGLYERWEWYMVTEKHTESRTLRENEKYKRKNDDTVKGVCGLLNKGKNYSEIAREMGIDRRTVKKIAVRYGFTQE